MKNSRNASYRRVFVASVVFALFAGVSTSADGRPPYMKHMMTTYPNLKGVVKAAGCVGCHAPKDKKIRNHYGQALSEALGEKNVKIPKKLKKAMQKIEPQPSAVKDKTFGDLIRMGIHPAATE